jgi:hypothetical protein
VATILGKPANFPDISTQFHPFSSAILLHKERPDEHGGYTGGHQSPKKHEKVDHKIRSKGSQVHTRLNSKTRHEPLYNFIRPLGGVNRCASRFARRLGRISTNPGAACTLRRDGRT